MDDYQQPQANWEWQQQLLDMQLLKNKDQASQQALARLDEDFNKLFVGNNYEQAKSRN